MNKREKGAISSFSQDELAALKKYQTLLTSWNKKFSFTATPDSNIFMSLIAPSAWLGKNYSESKNLAIADFGSGPGIPGLPMAIIDRDNRYILIESNGKKAGFMKKVVSELKLANVTVLHGRFSPKTEIDPVDRIVSRAAGEIVEVLSLFAGKTNSGAEAYFFKGSDADEEIINLQTTDPAARCEVLKTPDWFGNLRVVNIFNI